MSKRIVIVQGHPDAAEQHLCHALAEQYAAGAREAGHAVATIPVAELEFPLLRSKQEWDQTAPPPDIQEAQEQIRLADHLLIVYPLWLGTMPALLKAFLEQALRPRFAMSFDERGRWQKHLTGKSARVVITMGMPAAAYRWFFRAHSLKSLERNILRFVGIRPVHATLVGMVENLGEGKRTKILAAMRALGRRAR